ncbi:MAG: hypothetical protein IKN74_01090 [Clostridia bacterium]|jgi:hypothetical protein|nr:hypothetical protein [Bacilli bacterium]MBR3511538.1 hypothetical protein [Clostridia bacterium]
MAVSKSTREAYAEVDEIISRLDNVRKEKIPLKLRKFFSDEKDKTYTVPIDFSKSPKDQEIKKETLSIIAMLNLKYIESNEEERERLSLKYKENDRKFVKELEKKYSPDKLFGSSPFKSDALEKESADKVVVDENKQNENNKLENVKNDGIFTKIINFFKNLFK